MADVLVAMDAGDRLSRGRLHRDDVVDERSMTAEAALLQDLGVSGADLDRLVKVSEGERGRVVPAVAGLGDELRYEGGREVAVVADGDVVVARLRPGVVLLSHDVAIGAGARVAREVGQPLGVAEGEQGQAGRNPQQGPDDEAAAGRGADRSVPQRSSL